MQNANRSLSKVGKNMQKVGAGLTAAVSLPLLGIGGLALKAAADMETLKTSLDTVFQGNQAASSSAFQQIKEFAATTPFQLDEVATAFIKLKNLGLDPSIASLTSYGNTASALGKSLDQMIEAVADASVGEFERLKEFGIKAKSQGDEVAFTFQGITTTVGKNSAEISQYLQDIGNVNFAGSIERQANTFNGKLSTLKDNLTQAFAGIGEVIIDYITPLFEKINGVLKSFQELSPTTKKWIVILGGIAAAIGPLLALAGTILPAIGTGLALLTGPIGLIVAGLAAVGVIIYKNWAPIKRTLIDIANYFIDLYNESTVFRIAVESVVTTFKALFEIGKFVFESLKSVLKGFVDSFVDNFKVVGKIFKAVLTGNFKALPGIVKEAANGAQNNWNGLTDNLSKDWKNLVDGIEKVTNEGLANVTTRKKIAFIKENIDASAITEKVAEAVQLGITKPGAAGGRAKATGLDTSGLEQGGGLTQSITGLTGDLPEQIQAADENLIAFQNRLLDFSEATSGILTGIGQNFVEGFANVVAGIAQGNVGFGAVGGLLLSTLGDLATQLGKTAIKIGLAFKAIKLSFSNPAAAIAAGVGLLVAGQLLRGLASNFGGASRDAGAFADGGVVGGSSFYGDKLLARVNSGELILNQDQQKKLYGLTQGAGSNVNVTVSGKLQGSDLRLVLDRFDKQKSRLG